MTAKKSTAEEPIEAVEAEDVVGDAVPTAEELQDAEQALEDLLADMPKLRAPERLRLYHKNALRNIAYKYSEVTAAWREAVQAGTTPDTEVQLHLMSMAAEVDTEFAELIAEDHDAYEAWAEEHSDPEVFLAILTRYMKALGE